MNTSARRILPNRRHCETFGFVHRGSAAQKYFATVGYYSDATPGELFINSSQKSGTDSDVNAADGAIAISLALQFGCPIDTLRFAMKRAPDGSALGPLGHALDLIEPVKPQKLCICERGHDRPYWTCPVHGYVTVDA